MQLANRFKEEDKQRVWVDHQFCAICLSNQNCSLHHIDGTDTDSILSSIMLCYECHKKADGHNQSDERYKLFLMQHSFPIIFKSGYEMTEKDYKYLDSIHDRIKKLLI